MTNDPQWYEDMAKAMKKREHAYQMRTRWSNTIEQVENEIIRLSAETGHTPESVSMTQE